MHDSVQLRSIRWQWLESFANGLHRIPRRTSLHHVRPLRTSNFCPGGRGMSENIYDVLFWEMTNLVQHIKDVHPNHNSIPQIDKVVCMIIDARKILMELDE